MKFGHIRERKSMENMKRRDSFLLVAWRKPRVFQLLLKT